MKLYVCWGTFQIKGARPHPCRIALEALEAAGHTPEVVKVYGVAQLPDITKGRREVKRLTGTSWVPLLVTDAGDLVQESHQIARWAAEHPSAAVAA